VPWGLLAIAAIVFGGVSIFAVPPLGLIGIGFVIYYGCLALAPEQDDGGHRDDDAR
jgi:hypothetical protein